MPHNCIGNTRSKGLVLSPILKSFFFHSADHSFGFGSGLLNSLGFVESFIANIDMKLLKEDLRSGLLKTKCLARNYSANGGCGGPFNF